MGKRKTSLLIDEELYDRMVKVIPWGYQTKFLNAILEDVVSVIEEHGEKALLALMSEAVRPIDLSKKLKGVADDKPSKDAANQEVNNRTSNE